MTMTNTIVFDAMLFAREVHRDQRRKYTNNPYADHLAEVAGIVATVDARPETIAAAWLHDSIEDQGVTFADLEARFGRPIAHSVLLLSDLETGDRAARKAASRARLSLAPAVVQNIKCADIISNTASIVMHDPKFAAVYLEEKALLLSVLTEADPRLLALAQQNCGGPRKPAAVEIRHGMPIDILVEELDRELDEEFASMPMGLNKIRRIIEVATAQFKIKADLADFLGVAASNLNAWETGRAIPLRHFLVLAALSRAYPATQEGLLRAFLEWASTRSEGEEMLELLGSGVTWQHFFRAKLPDLTA